MKPQRIQRKRSKGWRMPENTVYVGRPTRFGNPYPVKCAYKHDTKSGRKESWFVLTPCQLDVKDGLVFWGVDDSNNICPTAAEARARAVELFKDFIAKGDIDPFTKETIIRELGGKHLACWCPLDQPCHADVLLKLANA